MIGVNISLSLIQKIALSKHSLKITPEEVGKRKENNDLSYPSGVLV